MKYYIFARESSKFDDITKDPSLKSKIYEMITWKGHLRIGIDDDDGKLSSYIMLKFGDDIRDGLFTNFTPIPGIDYTPIRK